MKESNGFCYASDLSKRALDISLLTADEREGLPTDDLQAERNLSIFDKRASKVAKCRNFRFTGKSIRNDMMQYKGNTKQIDNSSKIIMHMLTEREKKWTEGQKVKTKKRLDEKFKKGSNETNLMKKLLADCKSWNGPFTSGEEMITVIKSRPDQEEFIVKTGLAFLHTLTRKIKSNDQNYFDKIK